METRPLQVLLPKDLDDRMRDFIDKRYGKGSRAQSLLVRAALVEYLDKRSGRNGTVGKDGL